MKVLIGENNPMLRTSTDAVNPVTSALIAQGYAMLDMMRDADGVGLAAPQIGINARMFVATIWGKKSKKDKKDDIIDEEIFINPEIVSLSNETEIGEEGCLSLPGYTGMVKRSTSVTLRFVDKYKTTRTQTFSGFTARIIQHEYDHLDGILYIDKVEDGTLKATDATE